MRFRLLVLSDKKKTTKEDIDVIEFIAKNKKKLNGFNIFIEARTINLLEYNDPIMKKEFKAREIKSLPVLFNKKIKIYKDDIKEKLVMMMLDSKQSILNKRPTIERPPNPYLDKYATANDDDDDTGIDGEKLSNKDLTSRMNSFYSRRKSQPLPSNDVGNGGNGGDGSDGDGDDGHVSAKMKAPKATKVPKTTGATSGKTKSKSNKYLEDLSDDSDSDNGDNGGNMRADNVARPTSINLNNINEKLKTMTDDPTSGISDEDLLIRFGLSDD